MAYAHTIAAISTPSGKGGVAIIRISGDGALEIAERVFFPKSKTARLKDSPRVQIYGDIIHRSAVIDDGLATYFPAPHSYTGEDTVEICCHGGILITRTVLEATLVAGATPAMAGEFTRRAFINGRLSLSEAEGVADLIEAESHSQMLLASSHSRELLAKEISTIREKLLDVLSSVFARIDYPDEDLGEYDNNECCARLSEILKKIDTLLATYPTGKAIRDGVRTVICGRPNVGKSSVYNAILGEDAAIVTDVVGTTRDVLTKRVSLGRVTLSLSDTAGVRDITLADTVERIGIERSKREIEEADLIIAVFDGSVIECEEDRALLSLLKGSGRPIITLINKSDKTQKFGLREAMELSSDLIRVSAKCTPAETAKAIAEVADRLFTSGDISVGNDAIVSSARQNASLLRAREYIDSAIRAYESGVYADAAASEVERALGAISEIDGRAVAEQIVADVFSKFCVGK